MFVRAIGAAALAGAIWTASAHGALAECKLTTVSIPVTMKGTRPLITAKINGQDEQFLLDSGSFANTVSVKVVRELKLHPVKIDQTSSRVQTDGVTDVSGIGGDAVGAAVIADQFELAGGKFSKIPFLTFRGGGDEAGLIGQAFLHALDVEYDFGHDEMKLVQPEDCKGANMAYWTKDGNFSYLPLKEPDRDNLQTEAVIEINKVTMRATFDTGAETSFITRRAAARAGVKITDAGVEEAGFSYGIDGRPVKTWVARFASVKIGDEEIRNGWLAIGDSPMDDTDILIGADFFLAHHVYVANSQQRIFFSYNGGPVFVVRRQAKDADPPTPADAK